MSDGSQDRLYTRDEMMSSRRRIADLEAALAEERQLSAAFETLANAYRVGKRLPPERALSTIERIKERRAAIDAARKGGKDADG